MVTAVLHLQFSSEHVHGLILGTSKLEIFRSESSTWLEDDTLDRDINISGRTHLFVNGMLYVSVGYEVLMFEGLEAMSDGIPPYHQIISLPPEALANLQGSYTMHCHMRMVARLLFGHWMILVIIHGLGLRCVILA